MSELINDFPFLSIYRSQRNPQEANVLLDQDFQNAERYFLNIFEIGLFEVYEFLYQYCKSDLQFENWLITLKGEEFYQQKCIAFNKWYEHKLNVDDFLGVHALTDLELAFWEANGYLQLSSVFSEEDCDNVVALICETLGVDISFPSTWYPQHDKLQGLMLQLYQGAAIEKIRKNEKVFQIFSQLYQSQDLIANCEKVSYNPPETANYKFKGSDLHWDIDFNLGPQYYIQGLVYLNDVPINRGAFTLVPGFHRKAEELLKRHNPEDALDEIKKTEKIKYLDGKKGDLIIWLESLPHAASPNNSNLPRFVQYVSFQKTNRDV
ncbi:phytanoyl-CoA dioxygenase family protein [Pedobacter helvus]|uniref:Phytanoyl-CoA dioxygenase family protein n=1 Tax=Pedobacter helvus TaxID=2563444 RepID=A0ABW9JNU3_9SPHI|nr:phytanoyl-CoA dioxygenase family protein [Pedobacter ureilyticus]